VKKFRVLVRGENFFLMSGDSIKRVGFYATRFVEALDGGEAEQRAVESLRQNEALRKATLNDRSDPPMLFTEKVDEVSSLQTSDEKSPGLTFYDDPLVTR